MKICIFSVIKDEQEYLNDFLDYHTKMGLDIFVFEDVFSTSHEFITSKYSNVYLHSITELFSEEEITQLIEDKKNGISFQTSYINRGLAFINSLHRYDWCWLIDTDEFITATEPISSVLERFKERDAVLVYWKNFGCSGHIYKPPHNKPIYDIFTEPCGYELFSDAKFFKITKFCVNMNRWDSTKKYWIHNAPVNWIKADGSYKRSEIVFEPLYLRHYITKSVEEFIQKLFVRGMLCPNHRNMQSLKEMCPSEFEMAMNDKMFVKYIEMKCNLSISFFSCLK